MKRYKIIIYTLQAKVFLVLTFVAKLANFPQWASTNVGAVSDDSALGPFCTLVTSSGAGRGNLVTRYAVFTIWAFTSETAVSTKYIKTLLCRKKKSVG